MVRMDTNPFYPFFLHQFWHPWTLASTCCVSSLLQTMPTNHTHRRWGHGPSPMKNPGTKLQSHLKVSGWTFALIPVFSLHVHVPTAMAAHRFHCHFALFHCAACAACTSCTTYIYYVLHVYCMCTAYTHTNGSMRSHFFPLDRHLRGVAPFKSVCDGSLERHGRGGCVASILHRRQHTMD